MVIFKRSLTRSGPYEIVDCTSSLPSFQVVAKSIPVLILSTFYFSTYSMYMYHKGDYSSEILLCFFPEDQYTRSYKYRMKAMDKMTELGW